MGPPPPASLPDEIVEEILLRIPPSHPETLARAAIAQKRWCRLVSGNGFRRAYRARHRLPPTLGFFCYPMDGQRFTSFVPTSSFRPKPHADFHKLRPVDARHGRVLLRSSQRCSTTFPLVVWDPITRHQMVLPRPRGLLEEWYSSSTVLCAAPAGSCDHLDCHRGHFIVVLIGQRGNNPSRLLSCVYSSQDGTWSEIIFSQRSVGHSLGYDKSWAHVGNALYCIGRNKILKYDLGTRVFYEMEPPPLYQGFIGFQQSRLTVMEDGQLGLAVVSESTLYILSTDEQFGWGETKDIDLKKYGIYDQPFTPRLIGFVGNINLVFLKTTSNKTLSVNIRSAQVKEVCNEPYISWNIVPYINFWTPAMGGPSKDDQPRAGASRDVQSCVASSLIRQGK